MRIDRLHLSDRDRAAQGRGHDAADVPHVHADVDLGLRERRRANLLPEQRGVALRDERGGRREEHVGRQRDGAAVGDERFREALVGLRSVEVRAEEGNRSRR